MRFHRQRAAAAPALRAGEPWACLGTSARSAGAVATRVDSWADDDRNLGALADAFERAAGGSDLWEELLERRWLLDLPTSVYALRCLVGLVCHQTGETPRAILEAEFVDSPSDDFWRGELFRGRS